MERTLLAVEPDESGWQVSLSGKLLQHFERKITAIDAATRLAHTRHDATGEPTGVQVCIGRDDLVLIGLHG